MIRRSSSDIVTVAVMVACAVAITGCSSTSRSTPDLPNQIEVDIDNAAHSPFDGDTRRVARALHGYLVGQLLYTNKQFDEALKSFASASEMLEGPAPMVNHRLAELYLREGDVERSLVECSRAITVEPENIELIRLYAGLLEALGRDEEAIVQYHSLRRLAPHALDGALLLAHADMRTGDLPAAIAVLEGAEREHPEEALVAFYLGYAFERAGLLTQAATAFARASELDRDSQGYLLDRLRIALRLGKRDAVERLARDLAPQRGTPELAIEEGESRAAIRELVTRILKEEEYAGALADLESLAQVESELSALRMKLALQAVRSQQLKDAVRELLLTLALRPGSASARYVLASVYAGSGQNHEAVDQLEKIPEDDELFARSCTFAAVILRQEKNFEDAERILRRGLEVAPRDPLLLSYLIAVLRDSHKFSDAEEIIREHLERDPKNDRLLFVLAQVLHEQGREAEALDAMEEVVARSPQNAEALNFVAYGIVEHEGGASPEELDRALDLITRALTVKPNDGYLLDTLGWVQFRRGDYSTAVDTLERALAITGNDPVILEHCADASLVAGDRERAKHLYEVILDMVTSKRARDEGTKDLRAIEARVRAKLKKLFASNPPGEPS